MTPDNEWSTIDTSQSQNKEEDKVEFEIEGQEEQEVVETKPQQQPEAQTKYETEEDIPEKKPEANSSGAEKRIRQLVRQKKVKSTWVIDGKIYVSDLNEKKHVIKTPDEFYQMIDECDIDYESDDEDETPLMDTETVNAEASN